MAAVEGLNPYTSGMTPKQGVVSKHTRTASTAANLQTGMVVAVRVAGPVYATSVRSNGGYPREIDVGLQKGYSVAATEAHQATFKA